MRILITGAAGNVGSAVVAAVCEAGHEVVATDVMYSDRLPVKLHLANLIDPMASYRLLEGCDAMIHLGNHPTMLKSMSGSQLLIENTAMTSNVLWAAREVGVKRVVYISSIQSILRRHVSPHRWRDQEPVNREVEGIVKLPIHGQTPPAPGANGYAQSKVIGESILQGLCAGDPQWAGTALRLPFVTRPDWFAHRFGRAGARLPLWVDELTYVLKEDAASLCVAAVQRDDPGYWCSLPGQTLRVDDMSPTELAQRFLPGVEIEGELRPEHGGLIDCRDAQDKLGWSFSADPIACHLA